MREKPPISRQISQLAAGQHGHVTRWQLLALGVGEDAIVYWLRTGKLIAVHAGVYAVGHRQLGPIARAHAAVLACGEGAALSHHAAAALWGLGRWPRCPEVTARRERRRPGIVTHRSRTLRADDVTVNQGIRVTSLVRTICDIAPRCNDDQLLRAVDDARLNGYLGPAALEELVGRCPCLRRLVAPSPSRSGLERAWRRFAARHRLPAHGLNVQLHGYEVDVYFEAHRLVVELDGWAFHRGRRSFRSDRVRDTNLKDHGIDTIRLTPDRLTRSEADRLHRILANQLG